MTDYSAYNQTGVAQALAMGINESLFSVFPELKRIFDSFAKGDIAKARLDYFDTSYYQDLTNTAAQRQANQTTRPGVYAQEFDAWKQAQIVRLAGKGIKVTPVITAMLEQSYLAGDSDLQVDIKILDSGMFGSIGGSTLGSINTLKKVADDQGVNNLLPKAYWDKVSEGLFTGVITTEDVENEIKQFAMSAYPAYSKGIESGRSFAMQTSALKQMIANTYEIDVDTIDNNNPVFKELVGYVNPETKKPEAIPLWEAEKIAKSKEQWLYTKNARETFDNLGLKVLRDWGLA